MRSDKILPQVLTAEQLFELSGGVALPPAVRLDESMPLPGDERLDWERRLNRYLNSCGCAEGAAGLCIGLTVVLITYFAQNKPWRSWEIAAAVALPLALLIGGKLLGRWLDRLRFRRISERLLSRLALNTVKENHL
jgi:hypothetical protein